MAIIVPLIACVGFGYIIVSTFYNLFLHPLSNVPGPFLAKISGWPSYYHAFKADRHVWLWQQFQLYGDRVRTEPNAVMFNNPELYATIHSFKANVKRTAFYDAWSRNAEDIPTVGTSNMDLHLKKRRLLNLAFTDRSVKAAGTFMATHIDRWLEILVPRGTNTDRDGWTTPCDISTEANYLVFDVLGDLCFGTQFDTKEPIKSQFKQMPHAFEELFKFSNPVARSPLIDLVVWLKPRGLDNIIQALAPKSMGRYSKFVEDTVEQRVAAEKEREAEKRPVEREDMFHFLTNAKDPNTGLPAFGIKELIAEANMLVLTGSDTTSITISSLFFYLTHNERVYHKLVKEIRSTFASTEEIVYSPELLNSKYLRACIDETLRLSPVLVSEAPRQVMKGGMEIDGDYYPHGVIVGIPNWATNRNEEYYGDSNTFRPERWIVSDDINTLNTEEDVRKLKRGFHPFQRGPGDCVGQKIAMLQLHMVIARTLLQFDVRLAPGTSKGGGRPELGWGARNPAHFVVKDAYIALREGPMVQFKVRSS